MVGRFIAVLLAAQAVCSVRGFLHKYPEVHLGSRSPGDAGEPLFLTPYIEAGKLTQARALARVKITESLRVKSFAGYFTVNKTLESNQFFWYFPAMVPNAASAPVVVWLQGGPGASSLYGLFQENGPIRYRNGKLERRKYTWALNHHMIYIDNPVGTGFSFTKNEKGYCTDEVQVGAELYSTVTQFFKLFPELQNNKFFVTGESYGGKYVPALAYTIHKNNPTADVKINLKGIAIGNGLCDPGNQLVYGKYLFQHGLIDTNALNTFEDYEKQGREYIKNGNYIDAFKVFDTLLNGDLIDGKSFFYNVTGFNFYFNYLHSKEYENSNTGDDFGPFLQETETRQSIHVGELPFNTGKEVEKHLMPDIMNSIAPWLIELLEHYYVVIYNGQLDIIVAYPLTINYLKQLNFTGAEEYKTALRYLWKVDGELAGYVKQAGKLVEIMVRNAGHMVPGDQPKWALDLITRFTHEKTYASPNLK